MNFDKDAYLKRIGLDEDIPVDVAGLVTLHLAQTYAMPFENIDVILGKGVDLDPKALFNKLVHGERGGFCFELNGLFLAALKAFGFSVRPLLGRVHITGTPTGRTHALTLVTFGEQQWIADVGFGANGLRAPIPLVMDFENKQDGQTYKLVPSDEYGIMLQCKVPKTKKAPKGWTDLYSFDLGHVSRKEIEEGKHHAANHPSSIFSWMPLVTKPTPAGRVTLRQNNLRIEGAKTHVDNNLSKVRDYHKALAEHFDILLSDEDAGLVFEKC